MLYEVITGCLAALRQEAPPNGRKLPEALAATLSPLRFRRLLHADGPDEALRLLRRSLAMLDGVGGVRDVAAWAYALGAAALREDAARRLAFAYYGARIEGQPKSENPTANAADNA